jgi:hypothetical protein
MQGLFWTPAATIMTWCEVDRSKNRIVQWHRPPLQGGQQKCWLCARLFSFSRTQSSIYTMIPFIRLNLSTMVETEYHDTDRVKLLTALKKALNCNISSTIWAFFRLSDIDKLRKLVDDV